MNINMKSWLLKIPVLSVLVFFLSVIMWFLLSNHFISDTDFIYVFSIFVLPSFIIALLFNREINGWKSTQFGSFIGLIGGQMWLIYWNILLSINVTAYQDYSMLPIVWLLFSVVFIISGIGGALLSYFIQKNLKKK